MATYTDAERKNAAFKIVKKQRMRSGKLKTVIMYPIDDVLHARLAVRALGRKPSPDKPRLTQKDKQRIVREAAKYGVKSAKSYK